ncbi:MAG: hypothetical protein WA231_13405 [Methylocella sp.]
MTSPNFVTVLGVRLRMVLDGIAALFYRIPAAILSAKGSGLKEKLAVASQDPRFLRLAFRALRAFLPNLLLRQKFGTAYPPGRQAR